MIPVKPAKEPDTFDALVRQRGLRALAEMTGAAFVPKRPKGQKAFPKIAARIEDIASEKLPPFWTEALDDLMRAYNEICAYSCFRIHPVTGARSADHFAPKSLTPQAAYEWANYRLCAARLNSRKGKFGSVQDPFTLKADVFQLNLVTFDIEPNKSLSAALKKRVKETTEKLGLNEFSNARAKDAEDYWRNEVSLKVLRRESPFVAYELMRQGRLNAGDICV